MTKSMTKPLHSNLLLYPACIALAALFDLLFYNHPLGISAAIFTSALLLLLFLRTPRIFTSTPGIVAALFTLLATLALVEEPTTLALLLTTISFLSLVLISQRNLNPFIEHVSTWLFKLFHLAINLWTRILADNLLVSRWFVRHPQVSNRLLSFLKFFAWWILPLLAGLLFTGLFALANPILADYLSHAWQYLINFLDRLLNLEFDRMFLWLVVIVFSYGILRHRRRWPTPQNTNPHLDTPASFQWLTSPQMIIRLLLVLNLIFALENILDAAYLYGGKPLPPGLSYKEYAHRGAYTLIATALLAGIFTLVSFRHGGTAHRSRACRWLVYLWILQNILLLVSTILRLWIYVETYYLTRLRIATMIWSALVAAGFLWIILRIMFHKPNAWLWRMNAFTALTLLLACSFINFDGIIADYNVRHCSETGGPGTHIEFDYLASLGTPALPALYWYRAHAHLPPDQLTTTSQTISTLQSQLTSNLSHWPTWTYRRHRTANALQSPISLPASSQSALPRIEPLPPRAQ